MKPSALLFQTLANCVKVQVEKVWLCVLHFHLYFVMVPCPMNIQYGIAKVKMRCMLQIHARVKFSPVAID